MPEIRIQVTKAVVESVEAITEPHTENIRKI
jgi:hypothetical protein